MGVIPLSRIPVWQDPHSIDPDAAFEIGAADLTQSVTLTNVIVDESMTVEFGEELAGFQLWNARPLEIRTATTSPKDAQQLMTIEIAAPQMGIDDRRKDYRNHTAVISFRPSSIDWFAWSTFKSVSHDPRKAMDRLLAVAVSAPVSKEAAIWAALDDMKTDPFGNEDTFYARFRVMTRTDGLGLNDYGDEQISVGGTKANRAVRDPKLSLAICKEFKQCRELLSVSDLLQETLSRAQQGEGIQHDGTPFQITPTAQSLRKEIMNAAIIKALSGVNNAERANLVHDRTCEKFGSVAVLAQRIFYDDLRNLYKRTDQEGSIQPVPLFDFQQTISGKRSGKTTNFVLPEIHKMIQKKYEAMKASGRLPSSEAWRAILQWLNSELEDADQRDELICNACIYAAALARSLSMPDDVIESLKALRKSHPLFVEATLGLEIT